MDNRSVGSVEIDLVKVSGPVFEDANERLLNLYLIAKGFANAAIFKPDGKAAQIKDFLYKKDIITLRTKYLQKSLPNFDLFNRADRKSTRLNSSHVKISYAVFCLKKKNKQH